ncbi:STAS domain-containing protein [Actinophytocola glycyrrhizae]|uniref:STAS domain-containing protein n=1 Tax=Actinophytocola glycyrrhizae TaxID=2044873 RepID=A0ABV9RVY1_9PSEU
MRVESSTPDPGVLVLAVDGALTPATHGPLIRCLAQHVVTAPSVLLLDLSNVMTFDEGAAGVLVSVSRQARRRRVAVELVVSRYEVAKPIQLADADLLRGAWPTLDDALATVCGPSLPGSFRPAAQQLERRGVS